jgi:GR25 family glycosyltransferase involved in LPS biosynthesis
MFRSSPTIRGAKDVRCQVLAKDFSRTAKNDPLSIWRLDVEAVHKLTAPEVAITVAHWTAITSALDEHPEAPYVLVLEDDVSFEAVRHWRVSLSHLLQKLTKQYPDWEVVNISPQHSWSCVAWNRGIMFRPWVDGIFGAQGYIVRRTHSVLEKLHPLRSVIKGTLEQWRQLPHLLGHPSDHIIFDYLRTYTVTMPLVLHRPTQEQTHDAAKFKCYNELAESVAREWEHCPDGPIEYQKTPLGWFNQILVT